MPMLPSILLVAASPATLPIQEMTLRGVQDRLRLLPTLDVKLASTSLLPLSSPWPTVPHCLLSCLRALLSSSPPSFLTIQTVHSFDASSLVDLPSVHTAIQLALEAGWLISYAGTGEEGIAEASSLGIPPGRTLIYTPDHVGTGLANQTLCSSLSCHLTDRPSVYTLYGPLRLDFPGAPLRLTNDIFHTGRPTHG